MEENKKPRNPNAFPTPIETSYEFNKEGQAVGNQDGMTLRDYFANSAMKSLVSGGLNVKDESYVLEAYLYVAKNSYLIADAMLKQREL